MLRLDDVTVTAGARTLLERGDLHVHPGDRVGLVGRNGVGKTTLLRVMLGELEPESGAVLTRNGVRVGWLPQQAVSGSVRDVWDEARSGMVHLIALGEQLAAAEVASASGEDAAINRAETAREAFRLAGGFAADEAVGEVLHGLGFRTEDWHRACQTFSGGWQMRIALARVLLSDPDLLLLDEPTNHLDLASRSWLAEHLARSRATLIVVSHDRHLLDRVCNRTVEIRHARLESFSGNLTGWIHERARRDAIAEVTRERQDAEIERLERFVDRFGAKATKASQAQSRVKQIEKLEAERIDAPQGEGQPRFRLPPPPGAGAMLVSLRGASLGWDGVDVLKGVDIEIGRGERWVVLGPNGAGKSTLLSALAGRLAPQAGRRVVGREVRVGHHVQDLAKDLPGERTALEQTLASVPGATPAQGRSVLGALGLSGQLAMRPIKELSGGEKARVVLAAFALRPADLLLLDEPTNHLDAVTAEVLVEALCAWEGGLVVVTHDRWLVERLATHVARVVDGTIDAHLGVKPEDLLPGPPPGRRTAEARAAEAPPQGQTDHAANQERRRAARKLEKLMAQADQVSVRIGKIDEEMFEAATDHVAVTKLSKERADAETKLEALFEEMALLELGM